jgi:hypothetical protein
VWVDGDPGDRPFIPFSAGPVTCPGRDLVGLVTSLVLAGPRPSGRPPIPPGGPVPRTLSPFRLRFSLGVAAQPA